MEAKSVLRIKRLWKVGVFLKNLIKPAIFYLQKNACCDIIILGFDGKNSKPLGKSAGGGCKMMIK
jgi:hypothetical protein